METKSAVLGGLSVLTAAAIAFGGFAVANADNQPAPASPTVTATTEAPAPIQEPVVTEPAVEPVVEPAPVAPVIEAPAPVVVEPAPVMPEPVYVAPVVVQPAPIYTPPAAVYIAPAPTSAQTFEAPPISAPGVPNPILPGVPPGGAIDGSRPR